MMAIDRKTVAEIRAARNKKRSKTKIENDDTQPTEQSKTIPLQIESSITDSNVKEKSQPEVETSLNKPDISTEPEDMPDDEPAHLTTPPIETLDEKIVRIWWGHYSVYAVLHKEIESLDHERKGRDFQRWLKDSIGKTINGYTIVRKTAAVQKYVYQLIPDHLSRQLNNHVSMFIIFDPPVCKRLDPPDGVFGWSG
jgi:hypothetical protein